MTSSSFTNVSAGPLRCGYSAKGFVLERLVAGFSMNSGINLLQVQLGREDEVDTAVTPASVASLPIENSLPDHHKDSTSCSTIICGTCHGSAEITWTYNHRRMAKQCEGCNGEGILKFPRSTCIERTKEGTSADREKQNPAFPQPRIMTASQRHASNSICMQHLSTVTYVGLQFTCASLANLSAFTCVGKSYACSLKRCACTLALTDHHLIP
jgi:hypothetical protein